MRAPASRRTGRERERLHSTPAHSQYDLVLENRRRHRVGDEQEAHRDPEEGDPPRLELGRARVVSERATPPMRIPASQR